MEWDLFICHASEDKETFVRPLVGLLRQRKPDLRIWYDEFSLALGDSLREKIDHGLANSRFGVVVFSQHFFEKKWPQRELDGLVAREGLKIKVILPVWYNITHEEILKHSPTLADRLAARSADAMDSVVDQIIDVLGQNSVLPKEPGRKSPTYLLYLSILVVIFLIATYWAIESRRISTITPPIVTEEPLVHTPPRPKASESEPQTNIAPKDGADSSVVQESQRQQLGTSAKTGTTQRCVNVEVTFHNGEVLKGAHLTCGPRGWSSYVESVEYTKDLDMIRNATYGPSSGRIIGFDMIATIRFKDFNKEEKAVIDANRSYREWVRKADLTFNDGTSWENVYLLEICYLDTSLEHIELMKVHPATMRFTRNPDCK